MPRFLSVCVTLEPLEKVVVPCEQFDIDDDGNISAWYNGELWAYFSGPEYAYMVDDVDYQEDNDDQETESEPGNDLLDGINNNHVGPDSVLVPDDASELEGLPRSTDDSEDR